MQQEVVAPAPPLPDGANPGRAENAFIIYRRDKNTAYQLSCALRNLKAGEQKNVSKAIALMWHSEDPRVKEMYFQRARLAREVHRQMYPDYKFQPKRGPKPKGSKPKHHKRSVKKNFGPPGTTRSKTIDAEGYSELLFPPGPLATPAVTPTPPALSSASSSTLSSNGLPNELLPDLQSPSVASDGSEDAFFSFGEHELAMLTTPWMEDYAAQDGPSAMGKTSSHFETNASPNFEREHVLPTCTCPTQSTSALPTQNVAREAPPLDISYPQPDATLRADATWASMSSRPIHVIPVAPSTTVWRQNRAMASPALEWDTALAPLDAGFRDFSTVSNRATDYFASLRSAGHFPVPETSISQDFVRPPLGNVARPSDLDPPPSYTLEPLTSLGFLGANEFDAVIPVGHPMMDRLRGTVRDPEIHAKFEKMSSQLRNQVVLEPGLTHGTQAPSASDLVALVTTSPQDVAPEVGAQVGFKDEVASREEFSFDSDEARCWFRFEELR